MAARDLSGMGMLRLSAAILPPLDQVRVGAVPHPDAGVLVGPLQEDHPPLDGYVGVFEGAVFGQLLSEHPCQLPYPFVTAERAPVYEDHYVLRDVAANVLLEAPL